MAAKAGAVKMGGGNHLPSPRREAGRRGALGSGVGGKREEVTWGVRRALRARGALSVAPPPPLRRGGGAGGRGVKMAAGR